MYLIYFRFRLWSVAWSSYLVFMMMDRVHKSNDFECYTPSSEPFRFYKPNEVYRTTKDTICNICVIHCALKCDKIVFSKNTVLWRHYYTRGPYSIEMLSYATARYELAFRICYKLDPQIGLFIYSSLVHRIGQETQLRRTYTKRRLSCFVLIKLWN
jgi:hypothetical protein